MSTILGTSPASAPPPDAHGLGYAVAPSAADLASPRARKALWIDRYLPPIFITLILLASNWQFGLLESPKMTALAIGVSIAVEVALGLWIIGKVPHLASAYISGISVGILVRSPVAWPYALCAALSIVSKYALRLRGRHLWNPSNFGVSATLFLAPWAAVSLGQQWGNSTWTLAVIWCLGLVIVKRVRRLHVSLTYVLSFLFFALVRHWATGQTFIAEATPITGPMYQLFTFFMVTDPKTTVKPRWGQCLVVFLVAAVEAILRLCRVVHAPYYALFLVGPTAVLVEILVASRRPASPKTQAAPALAAA